MPIKITKSEVPVPPAEAALPWAETSSQPKRTKRPLMHMADRIFGKPLCITRTKCDVILGVLGDRIGLATDAVPMIQYDPDEEDDGSEYCVDRGIACVPIAGTLVKKASGLDALSGMSSYESLKAQIAGALEDPDVKGICFDCDSPGGEAAGVADLADYIHGVRGQKPMYAVVNDSCCSAAYWLASAADRIYTTRDGMVGSIGCYILHVSQAGLDKDRGLVYTYIQAGKYKTDGSSHEALSNHAEAVMQAEVDRVRDAFVGAVARNRAVSADSLLALEADVRFAESAIPLLADRLGTLEDAMRDLRAQVGILDDDDEEEEDDPQKPQPPDMPMGIAASSITIENTPATLTYSSPAGTFTVPLGSAHGLLAGVQMKILPPPVKSQAEVEAENLITAVAGEHFGKSIQDCFSRISAPGSQRWMDVQDEAGHPPLAIRALGTSQMMPNADVKASRLIRCCVAPYNSLSHDLGGFRERYSPGVFSEWLASGEDAAALFQHNPQFVLGRLSAGTVRFYEQADGFYFEAAAPETSWANDLLVSMTRGDITGSSAAFFIQEAQWSYEDGEKIRTIKKGRLVEASVANFAIYPQADSAVVSVPAAAAATSSAEHVQYVNELAAARLRLLQAR